MITNTSELWEEKIFRSPGSIPLWGQGLIVGNAPGRFPCLHWKMARCGGMRSALGFKRPGAQLKACQALTLWPPQSLLIILGSSFLTCKMLVKDLGQTLRIPPALTFCDFGCNYASPGSNAQPLRLFGKKRKEKGKEKHFHKSIYSTASDCESWHN